jgi:HTH-type transcriptional regulator/antitoxin HigA
MEQGETRMIKVSREATKVSREATRVSREATSNIGSLVKAWTVFVNQGIKRPTNEAEYESLIAQMDVLTEKHNVEQEPYASLFDLMARYALEWEELNHEPLPESDPHEVLAFLMDQQGLTQRDLQRAGIADQPKLSKILSGKLPISKAIAKRLAEHFKVPVDLFV